MSRLSAVIRFDVLRQARAKLYTIGVVIAVLFGLLLRFLSPEEYLSNLVPMLYIVAIGGTTFMFSAATLLLEKSSGTLRALRTSMITTWDYTLSKAITLTLFALVESLIVYAIAAWGLASQPWWLALGLLFLGVLYTFLGLGVAASHDTIQRFLFPMGALVAMILQLPFLSVLGIGPELLWYLIPSRAPLLLMQAGFIALEPWQWAYALGVSAASLAAAALYCRRRFATHVALPER